MTPLKFLLVPLIIAGCASKGDRLGDATCSPSIGMTEQEFLSCACFRPYLNPEGGINLISTEESEDGVRKYYGCMRDINKYSYVTVFNGKIEKITTKQK